MGMRIGFFGFGNMGEAIARGLIDTNTAAASDLAVYDIDESRCAVARGMGAEAKTSAESLAGSCECLILAVKPQQMVATLDAIKSAVPETALVISIAAGISIAFLEDALGAERRIIRVMPNTPAMVRAGASAFALSDGCNEADAALASRLFGAIGVCEQVPETAMDVVTALSGSGPAYFFYMVECMANAAASHGLPQDQAARLAAQTLLGSGKLLTESGELASALRERVTSKGGTTEAALRTLREKGFGATIQAAIDAAAARSRVLGQ